MIVTIGPLIMMKYVVEAAKPFNIPVTVSMNPIMIDGTGMCGGCRLTLNKDGKKVMKFACVDGPDFNGYEVDFDEAMLRGRMYYGFERHAHEKVCIVGGGVGCAIALPVGEEFHQIGADVTSIIGFRNKDIIILEDEFKAISNKLIVMTDDGSYAREGNVTIPLK